MGGTLRFTIKKSRAEKEDAICRIVELLDANVSSEEFAKLLMKRRKAYKNWAEQTLIELNEEDLWTKWILPD
ncbi:MAG: hypothetical protein Q8N39_02070 [Pelolinea sp.]|nr:hypothetical protein [Pelolinea sp.]